MSRHRLVRNLDLDKELNVDTASYEEEEDYELTPEQELLEQNGLDHIRSVLGSDEQSGFSDTTIKHALWDNYYDPESTIAWLLAEQERRNVARERKDTTGKDLPPIPGHPDYEGEELYQQFSPHSDRPHVPLIVLAQRQQQMLLQQQQQEAEEEDMYDDDSESMMIEQRRLSTIAERTERSELSVYLAPSEEMEELHTVRAPSSISTYTSYGQVIDPPIVESMDPNEIPPSPSLSAMQRLSVYEPAPSITTSESRTSPSVTPKQAPSKPLPPIEDVPDLQLNNARYQPPSPVPAAPSSTGSAKRSKLSMLASSRASSISTMSSRTDNSVTSSNVTYPDLRPTSTSELGVPAPSISSASSASSHIRRAIQAALDQEAEDKGTTSTGSRASSISEHSESTIRPPVPDKSPRSLPQSVDRTSSQSSEGSQSKAKQPSKLALLAQAKAKSNQGSLVLRPSLHIQSTSSTSSSLPKARIQYLTPIANGATATTAITTSYQTLSSLSSPTQSHAPRSTSPTQNLTLFSPKSAQSSVSSPTEPRRSKLAIKSKKALDKSYVEPPPSIDGDEPPPIPTMFLPKTSRTRASPSPFASLLIEEALTHSEGKDKRKEQKSWVDSRASSITNSSADLMSISTATSSKRRTPKPRDSLSSTAAVHRFAFDVPSPDDVVLSARRGTSLSQRRDSPAVSSVASSSLSSLYPASSRISAAPRI